MVKENEFFNNTPEFDTLSGYFVTKYNHEMTKEEFDNFMDKNQNYIDYNYPPLDEKQVKDYESYMYEFEQNKDAYESMTTYDWAQLDNEHSK